ncbi:MAG: RpiB/LacA/LacB family sugar-phosphate isomerase [Spirochaetia bacterium]|nr:MAG: RpiB/LacA/LacB family sugar-phosphate isomerase [Spirochaetia bacterium]
MLIYIGADHRGFNLKKSLKNFLEKKGYEVIDVGNAKLDENDDYPDFAKLVGDAVSQDPMARKGVLICGSGVGVDVVANKFKGVRSSLAFNPDQAFLARNDDDANVLSLPADFLSEEDAEKILGTWLATGFSGKEPHKRRLEKISEIESQI